MDLKIYLGNYLPDKIKNMEKFKLEINKAKVY